MIDVSYIKYVLDKQAKKGQYLAIERDSEFCIVIGISREDCPAYTDNKFTIWRISESNNRIEIQNSNSGDFDHIFSDRVGLFGRINAKFKSMKLNGFTHYLYNTANIFEYEINQAWTVDMHVYMENLNGSQVLFSKQNSSVQGILFRVNGTTGAIYGQMRTTTGTNYSFTFDCAVEAQKWHKVTLKYDGSANMNGLIALVDNVKSTTTPPSGVFTGSFLAGTRNWTVGAANLNYFAEMTITNISVFNDNLTDNETDELCMGAPNDSRLHSRAANLKGYYAAINPVFPTLLDLSGNGNHLEMKNMAEGDIDVNYPS